MSVDAALQSLRDIAERLRLGTGASRTTIRLDSRELGQELGTVAAESLDHGARSLEGRLTPDIRNSAAIRWLVDNRRTFVMPDCSNPWAPEVAPEDYVIQLYGIRSEMVRGVFRGDELGGVVSVHYTRGPREWSDADLAMIESACEEVLVIAELTSGQRPQ